MSTGRTTWYAMDAAEHDRELVVELGEEHGPAGAYLLRVMKDLAQQQRDGGIVRTGFRSLARKCFVDADQARAIVAHAAEIGALDDLELDDDGRRFTCRISGWEADQARGKSAFKKAGQRARDAEDQDGDTSTLEGDVSTGEGDMSPAGSPTRPNQTRGEEPDGSSRPDSVETANDRHDVVGLCDLLASLMRGNDPKAKVAPQSKGWRDAMRLLLDRDGRTAADVEQVIRFTQADDFERTVILSPVSLRRRFGQLSLKAQGIAQPRQRPRNSDQRRAAARAAKPAEACPNGTADQAAIDAWTAAATAIRDGGHVPDDIFALWLEPVHAHRLEGDELVLACPIDQQTWLEQRFTGVLTQAAGRPVRIVACEGAHQ